MSLIKFCGLFRDEDIEYANILKPDFIGFVYAKSKRQVSIEKSLSLKKKLDKNIKSVGVFLDNEIYEILKICEKNIVDIVQIHKDANDDLIYKIKQEANKKVIKAINISDVSDILLSKDTIADYILLDSTNAGSGKKFDYNILKEAINKGFNRDYFLAGGINILNIDSVINMKPYGIDISSGIEKNGIKDYDLMKEIIEKVRGQLYDNQQ